MPKIPTDENAIPETSTDVLHRTHDLNAPFKPSEANNLPLAHKKLKISLSSDITPIGPLTKSVSSSNILSLRDMNKSKEGVIIEDEEVYFKEIHNDLNPFSGSTPKQLRKRITISPFSNESDTPLKSPTPVKKSQSNSMFYDKTENEVLDYFDTLNNDPIQRLADAHELIDYLKLELESTEIANTALAESQEEGLQKIDSLKEELIASEVKAFILETEGREIMEQFQIFRASLYKLVKLLEKSNFELGGALEEAKKLLDDSSVIIVSDE
ncbi:hypothetical protein HK096_010971 [Nowakowskiella sp. JEL0078]|nr:hypothetical protein HK096_010971 [Nowakowskiella sp. JEL0078]